MPTSLHQNLIKLRQEAGYTQSQLAKTIGVSRPTYIQIEQGKRDLTITEAKKIADLYHTTVDNLSNFQDHKVIVTKEDEIKIKESPKGEMRISVPQKNIEKFKEVLLYLLEKIGAKHNVGETVIYKLLYFIDFDYYEKYEEQFIGATYIKNHYGPTPIEFKKVVEQMQKNGELELVKSRFFNYPQRKYLPLKKTSLKHLSGREIEHINNIISKYADKTAKELSAYSHQDVPWITAEIGKPIDYESALYRTKETSVRQYDEV
jgi:DNA-binding XRE family transcriptional regulator/uncharacterized phage-associated protein